MMFMNSIIDIADSLITDVIENPSLNNIRFVRAYGASNYNPSYEGFTAVVNIDEVKRSGGFVSDVLGARHKPNPTSGVLGERMSPVTGSIS